MESQQGSTGAKANGGSSSALKSLLLKQSFFQASVLLVFFGFLSKALGYVREMAIAGYFGARYFTDAFFLAQVIPVLGASFITSSFPLAFIPVYTSIKEKGKEEAERFASTIFWGIIFYLLLFCLIIFAFSSPLTHLIARGFSEEQVILVERFLISLLPLMVFQAIAGFFTAYLQAQKHFLLPALASALTNIPILLFIFLFAHIMPFHSLVLGFNAGYFFQFIILLPIALYFGFKPLLSFDITQPLIFKFLMMILPIVIGSSLSHIDMLIARSVASTLGEGIISALNYSYRLMGVPLSLMAGSITVAVFPFMSAKAAVDREALVKETMRGLYASWLVALPIGVIFFVLSEPIVRIMFERGAFTPEATRITAQMLSFFSLGIPAMTAWQIATRAFYSLQDTITPLKVGLVQIGIDIALLLTLPKFIGYKGLPLATSISISIGFLILWYVLCEKVPEMEVEKLLLTFGKVVGMCIVQGMVLFALYQILWRGHIGGLLKEVIFVGVVGFCSTLFYLLAGYMLQYPELGTIKVKLQKFFGRAKNKYL